MSRRERREFTEEFKIQMVSLYNNGKPRNEIMDCQHFFVQFL